MVFQTMLIPAITAPVRATFVSAKLDNAHVARKPSTKLLKALSATFIIFARVIVIFLRILRTFPILMEQELDELVLK